MTPQQIQRLLEARQAIGEEVTAMADTPRIARAVKKSREGKGRGSHLQASQGFIPALRGHGQVAP